MKRKGREVRSGVCGRHRERDKIIYGLNYFRNHPVGSGAIARRNELPNIVKVGPDFRVEIICNH